MSEHDEALTKLTAFDRVLLSLLGLVIIIGFGAALNAPFWKTVVASGLYCCAVQKYGRLSRPRDLPDPAQRAKNSGANIFDQRAIADNLTEAVWIINSREKIIYANHVAAQIFGPTPFGQRLATVLREPAVTQLVKTVLDGETPEAVDYHISVPIDRHLRVTGTPIDIETENSPPRRFAMLVFYDVTDLVKFARTQGDFLANASHELKTPVASLLGYIETLRGHAKDDPKAREKFLVIMQEQAQRMQRLISDLLSLRQIEQSEHIAPSSAADIRAAANFAIDTVSPLAQARGVNISMTGPEAMAVQGHQDQIVQMCLNIIDNAVKMTPKGGQVTLTLSQIEQWRAQDFMSLAQDAPQTSRQIVTPPPAAQGFALLEIKDEGPGFAPQHIPRLGERFYRIAGDRLSKDKGTGLGLAIVKHLVLRHRGGLIVHSVHTPDPAPNAEVGDIETAASHVPSGTSFTVILPLHTPPEDSEL